MPDPLLRHVTRGNQTQYVLGTSEHDWSGFDVVGFRAFEAISQPFRYEITLVRSAESGPVELTALVDAPATLAIATGDRWRLVHGILAEAECLEKTTEILLYRVLLVPHWWRARVRRHCRNFVNRDLREIISSVLANETHEHPDGLDGLSELSDEPTAPPATRDFESFDAPTASFRWAVDDDSRIRNNNIRAYVVQYNETDFDFVARLLEEEGISYYFEHAADRLVMTLSDKPGSAPLFERDESYRMRSLASGLGREGQLEVVRSFHERRTLRENKVTMRDFDWHRSHVVLEGSVEAQQSTTASADYFAFPARDERVYQQPCETPAEIRMQRFDAERQLARGAGTVRTMAPGYRFTLEDDAELVDKVEYLTVSVQTSACQLDLESTEAEPARLGLHEGHGDREVPWHNNHFRALDHEVPYRPPERTAKPRIHGIQTAKVTAEEYREEGRPEINVDEHARVRVRFPWDERPEDGFVTSDWIRVSQGWAGARYGALYHPRVGHEVLIAYLQGDPDRPLVVGRVYNVQNPPPYDGDAEPTKSTLKSQSSPDATGFNELRFEDLAGSEQIFLHAQKDLDERILHNHTTDVGHDQVDTVGNDQSFRITHHQSTQVGGDQSINVDQSRTLTVAQDETISIGNDRILSVGQNLKISVSGSRSLFVVGDNSTSVGGDESLTVAGERTVLIEEAESHTVSGKRIVKCEGTHRVVSGDHLVEVSGDDTREVEGTREIRVGSSRLTMEDGSISLNSGAGAVIELQGDTIRIVATTIEMEASGICDIKGQPIKLNCS